MAHTKEEYAALDRLKQTIISKMRTGAQVTFEDALKMNMPFSYGKTGRTKTLTMDDVARAHIDACIEIDRSEKSS